MTQLKKPAVGCGVLLVTAVVTAVILEYSIRTALPQFDPAGSVVFYRDHQNNVSLGPRNQHLRQFKNTGDYDVGVDFNKYGFRDQKDLAESTEQDYFVVGDSFSFGWGVKENERYSNRLGEKLNTNVFNISIPGAFNDYDALIKYAMRQGGRVKKLIVGVCMENDLADYEVNAASRQNGLIEKKRGAGSAEQGIGSKGQGAKSGEQGMEKMKPGGGSTEEVQSILAAAVDIKQIRDAAKFYLKTHSATYTAISKVFHQNSLLRRLAIESGWLVENLAAIGKNDFSEAIIGSSVKKLTTMTRPYETTILIIPSRGLWVGDSIATERAVHDRFISELTAARLDVLDMRSVFEQTENPLQFHFKNDGHWNAKGHRQAAEALARHFLSGNTSRASVCSRSCPDRKV